MSSYLLTMEVAQKATEMAISSFDRLFIDGALEAKRRAMAVVVLDPTQPFGDGAKFSEAVLYEGRVGEIGWERNYAKIAKLKAWLSWRTGLPAHLVREQSPYLYLFDDVKYGGSVVFEGGLIVGASGVEWYFDRMVAYWTAAACQALCMQKMDHLPGSADRVDGSQI